MSDNSNLKGFISKLNDRNLQRKRESGITSYVLISVLLFCLFKLYKNVSFFLLQDLTYNSKDLIDILCFTSNSIIAIYFILAMFPNEKITFSNLKLIKYYTKKYNLLNSIIMTFLLLTPIVSTVYSYWISVKGLSEYYYYFLGFLNIFSFILLLSQLTPSKKQLKITKSSSEGNILTLIIIIISIIVIVFSIILISQISTTEKFIFIKIIVLFYTVLYIGEKIVEQENDDIIKFDLENFEYEIYLNNLNDDQIRERLQENYIGYTIEYWLQNKRKEYDNNVMLIEINNVDFASQLQDINNNVDENMYPIEYAARKKIINENFNSKLEPILLNFKLAHEEIAKIIKQDDSIGSIELSELNLLKDNLLISINKYCKLKK